MKFPTYTTAVLAVAAFFATAAAQSESQPPPCAVTAGSRNAKIDASGAKCLTKCQLAIEKGDKLNCEAECAQVVMVQEALPDAYWCSDGAPEELEVGGEVEETP